MSIPFISIELSDPPEDYDPVTIHECADEWEQKGHVTCSGIVSYYRAYFSGEFR